MNNLNYYALVIGIADYQSINSLPQEVTNDATDMGAILIDPKYGNFPRENVTILLKDDASKHNIEQAFTEMADKVQPESTVFVFYSGHGGLLPSGKYEGAYLLPTDTDNTSDQDLATSSISSGELTVWLRRLSAQQVLVVFDCCNAGGLAHPKNGIGSLPFQAGFDDSTYKGLIRSGVGRAITASSRKTELSWVTPGDNNSLFTKHLLAGIKGGAARNDGFIRLFHLYEYLQPAVVAEKSIQHPVLKCEVEENFPIAYNEAHKGTAPVTNLDDGYEFDAYIACLSSGDDSYWVEDELTPLINKEGLKCCVLAIDNVNSSLPKITNIDRAIKVSRWVVLMISDEYLTNNIAEFENSIAQFRGMREGIWPVIPVYRREITKNIPDRIDMLVGIDLKDRRRYEKRLTTLIKTIKSSPPKM